MARINLSFFIVFALILGTCRTNPTLPTPIGAKKCYGICLFQCLIMMAIPVCSLKCINDCLINPPPPPPPMNPPPPPPTDPSSVIHPPPMPVYLSPPTTNPLDTEISNHRECTLKCATTKCTYVKATDKPRKFDVFIILKL